MLKLNIRARIEWKYVGTQLAHSSPVQQALRSLPLPSLKSYSLE